MRRLLLLLIPLALLIAAPAGVRRCLGHRRSELDAGGDAAG